MRSELMPAATRPSGQGRADCTTRSEDHVPPGRLAAPSARLALTRPRPRRETASRRRGRRRGAVRSSRHAVLGAAGRLCSLDRSGSVEALVRGHTRPADRACRRLRGRCGRRQSGSPTSARRSCRRRDRARKKRWRPPTWVSVAMWCSGPRRTVRCRRWRPSGRRDRRAAGCRSATRSRRGSIPRERCGSRRRVWLGRPLRDIPRR